LIAGTKILFLTWLTIDSSGYGELVSAFTRTNSRGGTVKLLHISEKVRSTLNQMRLLPVFEIFDDEESAIASFS
jgi:anti-sigma B factor antagonist